MIPSLQNLSATKIIIELWSKKYVHNKIKTWLKDCNSISSDHMSKVIGVRMKGIIYDWVFELTKCNTLVRCILSSMINPVGQKIFDWIQYYDTYVFVYVPYDRAVPWRYQNDIAVNYLDSLVWMRGEIDVEKTAKVLLSNENLTYVTKYHIACVHCLEDDIYNIASQVLDTLGFENQYSIYYEIRVFDTLTFFSFERQTMVYFWTAILKNDFTIFQKEIDKYNKKYFTNCTLNECVFQQVAGCDFAWYNVGYRNQIAIKYVWNYLSVEEKSRQIVFVINKTRNINIKYFLISQLTNEQKSRLFEDISAFCLLSNLWHKDCLWRQRFVPTVHQIWDLLQVKDFVSMLFDVETKMIYPTNAEIYNQCKNMFIELWQSAPNHLKKPYFENLYHFRNLFRMYDISNNLDVIKIMLCNSDGKQIIPLLKSEEIVIRCVYYIISNKWDLLKTLFGKSLLVKVLFPTGGVKQFEQLEVESRKYDRTVYFIQNRDMVENFVKWSCNTDKEIKKIKRNLAFSDEAVPHLKKLLAAASIETDYEEIEYFFIWCASGNENDKEIKELKELLPDLCLKEVGYKLIKENKYELLDTFLNWCFEKNEQKLLFKERLRDQCLMDLNPIFKPTNSNPLLSLIEKNDKFISLERFAIYFNHFYDNYILKDVISILKERLIILILEKCMFKLADEFEDWSPEPGVSKLAVYESSFIFSIFERCVSQENYKKLVLEALNWLSPTAKEVVRLKSVCKGFWWFELVLPIIDNYEKEREENQVGQNVHN